MSWAKAAEEARVSPATTARMVAKAIAEISANSTTPPVLPLPPPSTRASSGTAVFPAELACRTSAEPTSAVAPRPSAMAIR